MPASHLKSLQALELALREGSLTAAASALSITPAALGQRIRTLEDFLDTELIVRGRKGTRATAELDEVLGELQVAFRSLDRVTEALNFQKATAIHIVADADFSDLWLLPRLQSFRDANPNILFCINGEGDVPSRVGAPDMRVERTSKAKGDPLFRDYFLPVTSPKNLWRVGLHDPKVEMEGVGTLHIQGRPDQPDWSAWFEAYGKRSTGLTRGQKYRNTRLALEATRNAVGFMLCGLSFVEKDLQDGTLVNPFPNTLGLAAPYPFRP